MKVVISIFFSFVILAVSCIDMLNISAFYLHQETLEKFYCENLLEPELDCNGKCYLRKSIEQKDQEQKLPLPEQTETNINLISPGFVNAAVLLLLKNKTEISFHKAFFSVEVINKLFRPPNLALSSLS
jgi:hypothetical protein